jgi:hypothetical protein
MQGDERTETKRHDEVHNRFSQEIANAPYKWSALFVVYFTTVKQQLKLFVFLSVLPPNSLCLSIFGIYLDIPPSPGI